MQETAIKPPYPEHDFPWTLYFNGVAMPTWAECWAACRLLAFAEPGMEKWSGSISFNDLYLLDCRIDHVGVVESEDPLVFQVLCLQLLHTLLTNERAVLDVLAEFREASDRGVKPEAVYLAVRDGLLQMIERAATDQLAFWTVGYEQDRLVLVEAMRRHRLPLTDPEYIEAPHMRSRRLDALQQYESLRKGLIDLMHSSVLSKPLRTLIHGLPNRS